jgi:hypothetical protein
LTLNQKIYYTSLMNVKKLIYLIFILTLAVPALASTTTPEALVTSSGIIEGSNSSNFSVVGEPVAGVISSAHYVSGVGLASMIFSPLLPKTDGGYTPVATFEGEAIAYPNPFNPNVESVTIIYKLAEDAQVKVYIFDITGKVVKTISALSSSRGADGYSRVVWDGTSAFGGYVANGVYLVRIVYKGKTIGKTKILVFR